MKRRVDATMAGHTYFITGGFGFLGQYIVKAIRDRDPSGDLRVLVRTPRRTYLGIESMPRVRLIRGDLAQPESFASEMDGVDTVIHNGALVSFRRSDERALHESNIIGTENVLRAALENRCRDFVFVSSIAAIGHRPGWISDETMISDLEVKRRTDVYGYTKLVGERLVQAEAGRIRVVILNPSLVLGPGSRRIEKVASWVGRLPFVPMVTKVHSFVDVRDVAKAVVLALSKGRSGERYIVTAGNVSMLTFTRAALAAMGRRARVIPVDGAWLRLGDPVLWLLDAVRLNPGLRRPSETTQDRAFSAEKIRREIDWEPEYSLEQSLRDTFYPGWRSRWV